MDTRSIQSAYKKEKEVKVSQTATAKVTRVVGTRSLKTRTLTQEVGKNKATQRSLRSATKSTVTTAKSQSSIEFSRVITKGEKALEEAAVAEDDQQPSSSISEHSTQTETERVTVKDSEPSPGTSEETSGDPATNEQPVRPARAQNDTPKLVAEDTIVQERPRRSEDDLDDDIHPLARTVVKVTPRTYPRKVHDEEPSIDRHTIETRVSTSTLSWMSRKAVQRSATDTSLPLPSHLGALLANFKALESIHLFTRRQGHYCFYHKLKKHVELQSSKYDP